MRYRHGMRITTAVAMLIAAAVAGADCLPTVKVVSQPVVFPNRVAGPIASTGSLLGVAKTDSDRTTNAIYFAIYDSNLNQVGSDRKVVDVSRSGPAALFWTGSEFDVFYQSPSFTLMLQRIDATGTSIGNSIPIANHPWNVDDEFDVAWSAARNGYVIARTVFATGMGAVFLTVISPSGEMSLDVNVTVFVSTPALPRAIALNDGTVGMAWFRQNINPVLQLWLAQTAFGSASTVATRAVSSLRVGTDGSTILAIFSSPKSGEGTELRYSVADKTGNMLTQDAALLSGTGLDVVPQSLVWNPALSEWALVYVDASVGLNVLPGDTRLRRFKTPDTIVSDTLLSPDPLHSILRSPFPVVFFNGGYVASIERILTPAEGSESYLVKTCPFFVTVTADRPSQAPFFPFTFTATPSGGLPDYTYFWDFGDLTQQVGGAKIQHIYTHPGTYTVTVTATDSTHTTSTFMLTVRVVAFGRQRAVK